MSNVHLIKITSKVRDRSEYSDELGQLVKAFIRDGGAFKPIIIGEHSTRHGVRYVRPGLAGSLKGRV